MGRRFKGWENVKVNPAGYVDSATYVDENKPETKYHNVPCTSEDGIRFQSKRELRYANQLDLLKKAGAIKFFLRQVGFDLPGKIRHFVDFLIFYADGTYKFVEVKGRDLPMGKLKRHQVEKLYEIKIYLTSNI